jgi:cyanate lyase
MDGRPPRREAVHDRHRRLIAAEKRIGVRWADLGKAIDMSTEWTTAALLGQRPLTEPIAVWAVQNLDLRTPSDRRA